MGRITNVRATPGGSVRLDLPREGGGWRVTHLRPEVKSRLAELYGLAEWGAWRGFVAALTCCPFWLLIAWAGLRPAAAVTGWITAVGAVMAVLGLGMLLTDAYELFGGILYVLTAVVISPLLLFPAFQRSLEYTIETDAGPPIWVPANGVTGAWLETRGNAVAVTFTFHNGGTVTYEAAGRPGTKLHRGFNRLLGHPLARHPQAL
ncbi:hypothetical protein [Actinoplanes sp. NPDC049681]|uniref:hypothetical protein n=1 Tax=Actinoplanes sp. NPDC049681 TaxID=3363905 RepID=UPI0037B430D7